MAIALAPWAQGGHAAPALDARFGIAEGFRNPQVMRDDGSRRPVGDTLRTAVTVFAGYNAVHFVPLVRETQDWSPWAEDPTSLTPNWQIYQVAFDKPGNQRVTAIWNGDGVPQRV